MLNKEKIGEFKTQVKHLNEIKEEHQEALARIHAHLCGDGGLYLYATAEKDRKNRAEIAYFNTNYQLISSFQKDMEIIFGVKMTYSPKHSVIKVKSLRIAHVLLALSKFGTREWRIPNKFHNAKKSVKIAWITAFCLDESYVIPKRNLIRIKSMNVHGLKDLKELLESLKINAWITGMNCDKSWYLNIRKEGVLVNFVKSPSRKKMIAGSGLSQTKSLI